MTIKRTRPTPDHLKKRLTSDIGITIYWQEGYAELTYGNAKILHGEVGLVRKCEKMLKKNTHF